MISILIQVILVFFIYIFTKNSIYIIITLLAAVISISGFMMMIKIIDRIITAGKGTGLFFISGFFKLVIIAAIFYPISKISESAVLFYILGLSTIVISILFESCYQLFRKMSNGT